MLLTQQQARLEAKQRTLDEIKAHVQSEMQARMAAEERETAERRARDAAQTRAMLAHEAILAAQQRTDLEEQESARLRAQIEQSRAEVATHQLMARLRKNKQIGRLVKGAVLVSAMSFIGLSLPVLLAQKEVSVQPAAASQLAEQAGEDAISIAQAELKIEQLKPASYLALSGLKLTDQLGQRN